MSHQAPIFAFFAYYLNKVKGFAFGVAATLLVLAFLNVACVNKPAPPVAETEEITLCDVNLLLKETALNSCLCTLDDCLRISQTAERQAQCEEADRQMATVQGLFKRLKE